MNTILIVDDNVTSRKVLASRLTEEYNIVFADDGNQAVEIINNSSIVCILMNFNVPKLSGLEIMDFMKSRKINEYIPVILICSDSDKKYIRAGYEAGIADMIHRPFDNIIIKKRIDNVIRLYMQKRKLLENREKMEKALVSEREALQSKTSFLINMSHDIRVPMLTVVGMAELAKSSLFDKEKALVYLERLSTASDNLIKLINDILDMSRIENNKLTLHEEKYKFTDIVKESVDLLKNQVKNKSVRWDVSVKEIQHDNIITDSFRVRQVLTNIISDLIEHAFNGECIDINISETECTQTGYGRYIISIVKQENGEEDRYQVEGFSNINKDNINMIISKSIVAMLGGSINYTRPDNDFIQIDVNMVLAIDSENKDEVLLMQDDFGKHEELQYDFEGKKVLVVDDNAVNRMIACDMMEDLNIEALEAENGKQAVDIIRNSKEGEYDAVFMDLQMPVVDGYTAAKLIRESESNYIKNIPIIAMSAETYNDKKFEECGMDYYLLKPTEFSALCDILHKIFEG